MILEGIYSQHVWSFKTSALQLKPHNVLDLYPVFSLELSHLDYSANQIELFV